MKSVMTLLRVALGLALFPASSTAQELVPLLRSNDRIAGEPVLRIESPVIGADRHWAAVVSTWVPGVITKHFVVDGVALLTVGDVLPDRSARVRSLLNVAGSADNLALFVGLSEMLPPLPSMGRAVLRNGEAMLLTGTPLGAMGLPADTLCHGIYCIGANSRDTVVALVDTAEYEPAIVRLEFDEQGVNVARTVDLRVGQTLPDGSIVSTIETHEQNTFAQAVSEDGNWIWSVTASDGRERLVTRQRVLLRSGDPSPVPGRTIRSVRPSDPLHHALDLNDLGGYAALVMLSGDPSSDELLVVNSTKLAQEGDVLPSLAPYALVRLGMTTLRISNSGHVDWVAVTDGPRGENVFLMRDLDVLVRPWQRIEDRPVTAIDGENIEITPDGRYLAVRLNLGFDRVLLRIDLGAAEPLHGCEVNSGTLRHTGGRVLTGHSLRLALDGPARPGARVRLQTSLGEATPGDPCGIRTPFGELLIDPKRRLASLPLGIFASGPVHANVALPDDPALVDLEIFAQGAFVSPDEVVLTNGMRFLIGAH